MLLFPGGRSGRSLYSIHPPTNVLSLFTLNPDGSAERTVALPHESGSKSVKRHGATVHHAVLFFPQTFAVAFVGAPLGTCDFAVTPDPSVLQENG